VRFNVPILLKRSPFWTRGWKGPKNNLDKFWSEKKLIIIVIICFNFILLSCGFSISSKILKKSENYSFTIIKHFLPCRVFFLCISILFFKIFIMSLYFLFDLEPKKCWNEAFGIWDVWRFCGFCFFSYCWMARFWNLKCSKILFFLSWWFRLLFLFNLEFLT